MEAVAVILLAGVFAVAGFVKLRAPLAFRAVLQQLMPSSVARGVGRVVPIIELGTALLLLSGLAPRLAAGVAMALLVTFVVILAQMWRRGASMDCGCFGESPEAVTPASGLLRNAGLLTLTGVLMGGHSPEAVIWSVGLNDALASASLSAGIVCCWLTISTLAAHRVTLFPRRFAA